ncbi:MAG: hypothetical protein ABL903_19820 [Methylococcales bacterium]
MNQEIVKFIFAMLCSAGAAYGAIRDDLTKANAHIQITMQRVERLETRVYK